MTDKLPSKERLEAIAYGGVRQSQEEGVFMARALLAEPAPTVAVPLNTFTDEDLAGMAHGDNPVANAYRELLEFRRNSPVIGIDPASGPDRTVEVLYFAPPGYAMVPVEPTEDMVIEGFESAPDRFFSEPEVWEAYQAMSGCKQAAHRARLCWSAMLAAVPKTIFSSNSLEISLPDSSSKAFWSGSGKTEVFLPETYKRWVKEAIERDCCIAQIDVKVK